MAKFWKSVSILKNHFKIFGKYFEKSLLPDCPDWKENSTMIKKSYVPFYQSLIFLFLLSVVSSVSKNTCISIFFNKFSSNIEKILGRWPWIFQYYFRIHWKKSQYKSFTTQKQQQLGENKKIRLWSTGNSYFKFCRVIYYKRTPLSGLVAMKFHE